MALVYVHCPECQSIDVVQYGKQANGTQRYRCNNRDCPRTIFGFVANFAQEVMQGQLPLSVAGIRQLGSRIIRPQ